jgi:response regulator RpfG family c-di-GMP phosphodiesterase
MKTIFGQEKASSEGYISIPIDSFIHFKTLPFDLYIKLGESNYVKRINANEDIDEQAILKLKEKGVAEFHFERKFNRDFSIMLINNMINKVESKYTSMDAQLKATNEVFLTTKEIVQSIGLPPKVIQVCESVMERITTDVALNKDKLSSYLTEMKSKSALNFQFRLVELTSFIATQMIETEDAPGKEDNIKKVVFASFFCDISLKDNEHLHLRDNASLKDVWPEDKKMILEHAFKSSEIVAKYKNAPEQTAEIVKQHHGSPSGIGFPEAVTSDLLPMAVCLMAAQELAYQFLMNPVANSADIVINTKKKMAGTPLSRYLDFFVTV